MILYLSGPITGIQNYMDIFNQAETYLVGEGYQVINPANMCYVLHANATWSDYMSIDMELLHMADALIQLPGWENSLGCQREYGAAMERDMLILRLEDLVDGCTKKSRKRT